MCFCGGIFFWHVANFERGFCVVSVCSTFLSVRVVSLMGILCKGCHVLNLNLNYTPKNQDDKLEITIYFSRRYIDSFMDDFPACHASFQGVFSVFLRRFP